MAAWVKACKDLYCCTKKFYHGCNILTNQIAQKDTFETQFTLAVASTGSQSGELSVFFFHITWLYRQLLQLYFCFGGV